MCEYVAVSANLVQVSVITFPCGLERWHAAFVVFPTRITIRGVTTYEMLQLSINLVRTLSNSVHQLEPVQNSFSCHLQFVVACIEQQSRQYQCCHALLQWKVKLLPIITTRYCSNCPAKVNPIQVGVLCPLYFPRHPMLIKDKITNSTNYSFS